MSILATKEISMSKVSSIENPVEVGGEYREQVLTVEPPATSGSHISSWTNCEK
jgi:hypothetical protein